MEPSPAVIIEQRQGARNNRVPPQMGIPPFGHWDFLHHDQIPITQYFDFHHHHHHSPTLPRASLYPPYSAYNFATDALFPHYNEFQEQHYHPCPTIPSPGINLVKGGGPQVNTECGTRRRRRRRQQKRRCCLENKNKVVDFDTTVTLTETPDSATECSNDAVGKHSTSNSRKNLKAKDEDLYKIPPELLRNTMPKRKMSKLFMKCFVTICASY